MNPFGRRAVTNSADFQRIVNLPERAPFDGVALAKEMTEALKTPGGTMALRPVQAQALYEIMTTGGLCAPMGVGTGKTLVFLLAPVVLGLKRALGILPASLVMKTERERGEIYAPHWNIDRSMQLFSYEALGRVNASNLLETKMPDGIVTDESHRLKNPKAACTRRVARWMREHPDTKFLAMSGTILGKSIRDMAHLLRWSLGPEGAPIPQTEGELSEWADCLDERVNPLQRVKPGALLELAKECQVCAGYGIVGNGSCDACGGMGQDELTTARRAFHHRLVSTRGVVCSLHDEQVNCSIYIEGQTYEVNAQTEQNFDTLRNLWETPDGWALSEAVDVWRHARELALGLHDVRVDGKKYNEWRAQNRQSGSSKPSGTEPRTLSASGPTTGSGALAAILAGRRTPSSATATGSASPSTSASAPSSTELATSADASSRGSASTTTTSPVASEESSASPATEPSDASETMSSDYRTRFDTFVATARPPDSWLSPRRAWAKFVRDTLARSRSLDSEKQVADACARGDLPDGEYRAWLAVRDTFQCRTLPVWHDESVLDLCAAWLAKEKGICWVEHTWFGKALSQKTGLSYYGQSGLDAKNNSLVDWSIAISKGESKPGPFIASVAANGTGKNLQAWNKNLIVSCPTGASVWEQLLGRTHRQGQLADEVSVDVLIGCIEHVDAWKRACAEARMASDMLGAPQKILIGDVTGLDAPLGHGTRWAKVAGPAKDESY